MNLNQDIEGLNPDSQARPSKGRSSAMEGRACESVVDKLPKRKSPPHFLPVERPNQSIVIFLTMCTKGRRKLLANQETLELLVGSWKQNPSWLVGRFVVMPDHLHLFCSPTIEPESCLRDWVFRWRNMVTRSWPRQEDKPIWQKDFFDRQLRNGESYEEKWEYVLNNPVRAGLVQSVAEWAYQGELNDLEWHDAA